MIGLNTGKVELSTIKVRSIDDSEGLSTVTKVERQELLMINNPQYQMIIDWYAHLKGVEMTDSDLKPHLPVHLILRASEYAVNLPNRLQRMGVAESCRDN